MRIRWKDTHGAGGATMRSAISQADMSMRLDLVHFSFICEPSVITFHQSKVGRIPETMLFLNTRALATTQKRSSPTARNEKCKV